MPTLKFRLRDRDAIVTNEGIVFRVYGYTHPSDAYVCDPEYAPESIYRTSNPRAYRKGINQKKAYYKFYFDEGLCFVQKNYPRYTVFHEPLRRRLVGVKHEDIKEIRESKTRFRQLMESQPDDALVKSMQEVFSSLNKRARLSISDFGVFGSLLHGFYHPRFSDIDLTICGREKLETLREVLESFYGEHVGFLRNEFDSEKAIKGKKWQFDNYSAKEFVWHQQRKLIYGLFDRMADRQTIKVEFEPVKEWREIHNEYGEQLRVTSEGWVKATVRVTGDRDASFMPSIYDIEPIEVECSGKIKADNIRRILSYVEEFRMQTKRDEVVYVEGNLEKVTMPKGSFHQITLSYGPRYFEQVLKVKRHS